MIKFNMVLTTEQPVCGGRGGRFRIKVERKTYQDKLKGKAKVQLVHQMLPQSTSSFPNCLLTEIRRGTLCFTAVSGPSGSQDTCCSRSGSTQGLENGYYYM